MHLEYRVVLHVRKRRTVLPRLEHDERQQFKTANHSITDVRQIRTRSMVADAEDLVRGRESRVLPQQRQSSRHDIKETGGN